MKRIEQFLRLEVLAGLSLGAATIIALVFANSSLADFYQNFIDMPFSVQLGEAKLGKPLLLWINDGLMAIFFLLVGLELKREVLEGELSSPSQVILPLVAAVGGMVVPAILYLLVTGGDTALRPGWAIPIATDIAFALGVLSVFGSRIPSSLKTFLLTLAVFDDLGAILVIAFVYSGDIYWPAQAFAAVLFLVLLGFNRLGVVRLTPYCIVGALMWLCVLKSGVHATLAGVLLGLTIPLHAKGPHSYSPLHHLEHGLHPWVAFLILPIFAFANAGINLSGLSVSDLFQPLSLGIILGLLFGKCIGVFSFSYALIRSGFAGMPAGASLGAFIGVSLLSGIGFTMSLFIGTLAFETSWEQMGTPVRLGVLCGSLISGILGAVVLLLSSAHEAGSQTSDSTDDIAATELTDIH